MKHKYKLLLKKSDRELRINMCFETKLRPWRHSYSRQKLVLLLCIEIHKNIPSRSSPAGGTNMRNSFFSSHATAASNNGPNSG